MKLFQKISVMVWLIAILAMNALASVPTAAPPRSDQQRLRWKNASIKIALSSSLTQPSSNIKTDSDVLGALRRSIEIWQSVADVEFELVMSDKQNVSPSGVAGDRVNLITIAQSPDNVLLFSKTPQTESAKTRVFYNGIGHITEADIVLNPFQQFSTDGTFGTFDLESTLTQEIGHLLGLRHSGVLGATMADSTAKNGNFGFVDFGYRSLAESDIAAARDLYGAFTDDACCAAISGKLTNGSAKPAKLRVWAEESKTGRVMGQVEAASDGSFRLGGLHVGTYSVFWQKLGAPGASTIGQLGTFDLEMDETRVVDEKVNFHATELTLDYVGINGQLADLAVPLSAGRDYLIYIGGNNIRSEQITINFSSPFLKASQDLPFDRDFGQNVSAAGFVISVDKETPPGVYSIFATGVDGSRTSLIGALNVEN